MLCRTVLTAIAISYILCVLLLSGLQKEDMDVNTLKKLERHNVNIHDMNNETLRQECLGQNNIVSETTQRILKIESKDKSYDYKAYTQTTYTPNPISYTTTHKDQYENATSKELRMQKDFQKASNVSETGNKDKTIYEHQPTLERIVNLWNKLKNTNKVAANKVHTEVPITSPATETVPNSNIEQLHSSEIEYIKKILGGYFTYRNITTSTQNNTKAHDYIDTISPKSHEDLENNEKRQKSPTLGRLNVSPLPYDGVELKTRNRQTVASLPKYPVNNADFIDYNFIAKGSTDIDPRNKFINPNKQPKHDPGLVNIPSQEDMNVENLMKNIASPLHTNKRELNDLLLRDTNSQLNKKISGVAASEFYPRISDIGQSSHNNEPELNDIPSFKEKSKDKTNIAKLEDWYSSFFRENMDITTSLASNKKRKELAKESLFDITYNTFNDNKQADKSRETQYLEYSTGNYKITQATPPVEPDNEAFDINSLFSNNKGIEKSKDMPYPDFNSKSFNPDIASNNIPSPSRDNDEENEYGPERNNKKAAFKTSFLTNNPKLEDLNLLNSPKTNIYKNERNDDYEKFEGVNDAPFIGSNLSPDNFISSFKKIITTKPVQKDAYQNNDDEYIETTKESTLPENDQPFEPRAINGKQTNLGGNLPNIIMNEEVEMPKVIPPFLENAVQQNNNSPLKKINPKVIQINTEAANVNPIYPFTNNKIRVMKNPQDNMQYNRQLDRNAVIQGNKLRLIKNSLQYINQILAINEEVNSPSIPCIEYTTSKNINTTNNQTAKLNIIKQRKNKTLTKMVIPSNRTDEKSMTNIIKSIPADLIKHIAESVKNIILKDLQKDISTEIPIESTTLPATTITTVETTVSTTEKTTVVTEKQEEPKTKDANYVVQKILELFRELKTGTDGTTSSTLKTTKSKEAHVMKYVFTPSKNDQLPPMPAYNPYGVKPEINPNNFTNPYNQGYGNCQNNSNMDSSQPPMLNQTSEMISQPQQTLNQPVQMRKQSPPILNQLQTLNQPPQFYNQPLFMFNQPTQPVMLNQPPERIPVKYQELQPPQFINQPPQQITNQGLQIIDPPRQVRNQASQNLQIINPPRQVTNQAPQMYHYPPMLNQPPQISYEPVQVMNQPPIFTNPALQSIYHVPQMLNHNARMINQPSQIINQEPQMVKETIQTLNRSPQMLNQPQQMINNAQQMSNQRQQIGNQAPQILKQFSETFNQPSQILNQEPQMIKETSQIVNQSPEMFNQPTKHMNQAQQILNQALQMKNHASQTLSDSPEMPIQTPQIESRQKVFNQGLQMMNNYPDMWDQRQTNPNRSPQMLNQPPQTMHQSSEPIDSAPQMTIPMTNAFQSPQYVTFQTNSDEIPPLGIPMEKPRRVINQVIIVTTKGPFEKPKEVRQQREPQKWLNDIRKEREQNRSDLTKKLRVSDSLKHYESREPPRNRSTKIRVNSFNRNYSGNHREPYKQRYRDKKPDYDRARPRHLAVKKFHEQLERTEDWSNSDRKRSKERVKDCCDDVPSRQQVPLTKIKQRSRFDDTHFRNFLKTQEKVNDMLEAILATKKNGRPRSVEIP